MIENIGKVILSKEKFDVKFVVINVFIVVNMFQVSFSESDIVYRFAVKIMSEGVLVFVFVSVNEELVNIVVNCEKMVIGIMLFEDISINIFLFMVLVVKRQIVFDLLDGIWSMFVIVRTFVIIDLVFDFFFGNVIFFVFFVIFLSLFVNKRIKF